MSALAKTRNKAKQRKSLRALVVEYRKAMAVAAFLNLIDERPGIATSLYRNYLEIRM